MKQLSLSATGFHLVTKRTRKRVFLDEMNLVVPWAEVVGLIEPHVPALGPKGGRPAFVIETMLRIHFMQQWFGLSDPAMEEALHDVAMYCEFAGLDPGTTRLPDESTILRFRHLLQTNGLALEIMATINAMLATKGLLLKASVRAKVEHPFRAVKRQFGYVKVRYRRLAKNTAQLTTLLR